MPPELYSTKYADVDAVLAGEMKDRKPRTIAWHDLVIHPMSVFRYYWDLTVFLLVAYTMLVTPFRLAYYWNHDTKGFST